MRDHKEDALRTAQIALTFLDVDNFSVYEQNASVHKKLLREWQKIADIQDVMFIYVIEPFNGYKDIRFGVDVVNTDSEYDVRPIGYVTSTSSDEYKTAYQSLYASNIDHAIIVRDNDISLFGDHITAIVPIKDSFP